MMVDTPGANVVQAYVKADAAKRGWTVVSQQQLPLVVTNATAQARAVAQARPDYVIYLHNDTGALPGVEALRTLGVKAPVINVLGADSTLKTLGTGYYVLRSYVSPADTSVPGVVAMQATARKYGTASEMVSSYFTQGYVGGMIIEQTLKACKNGCESGKDFRNALEGLGTINTNGLSEGPMTVSAQNHDLIKTIRFATYDPATGTIVSSDEITPTVLQQYLN